MSLRRRLQTGYLKEKPREPNLQSNQNLLLQKLMAIKLKISQAQSMKISMIKDKLKIPLGKKIAYQKTKMI